MIEACGEEFGSLSTTRLIHSNRPEDQKRLGKIAEWVAIRHDPKEKWCGEPGCCPACGGEGETPEEAVKKLLKAIKKYPIDKE